MKEKLIMIEIKNLSFSYQKGTKKQSILNDINLKIESQKIYSIFGPSGSGKTTLLSILGGLEKPNTGTILFDGKSLYDIGQYNIRKRYVSYVFQNYLLFPYMTAIENVIVAMDISGIKYANKKTKAIEILLSLGLKKNDIIRRVNKLSGGQQQRVAIARSIASEAQYILADEPTGNLDKNTTIDIINIFRELVDLHKKTIIIVTHSDLIRLRSDVSYQLDDGKLRKFNSV